MPILNMVGGGKKGGNIGEPLNLAVTTSGLDATITWEDNEIGTIPVTTFQKSELVRKVGSAPTSPSDGDLVVTETVKDTYKTTGYVDQGLTDGETYYYRVFSYSDLGGISYCDAVSVTPSERWQPGVNTVAYYPLTDDFSDYSGNSYNLTQNNTNITTIDGVKCCDLNNSFASANFVVSTLPYTICFWAKAKTNGGAGGFGLTFADNGSWGGQGMGCRFANKILIRFGNPTDHSGGDVQIDTSIDTNWHLRIGTFSSSGFILYKDGTQAGTYGSSLHNPINSTQPLRIGANEAGTAEYSNGYMGGVIVEDKARTAQEVSDYFDLTKGDYGIS